MDKLDQIFDLQKRFDSLIEQKRNIDELSLDEWVQKEVIAIIAELIEVVNEVNYKWWKNPKEINLDALKEELIDVLHFFISTCLKVGLTSDELFEVYKKKNRENHDRQNGKSSKKGYELKDFRIN